MKFILEEYIDFDLIKDFQEKYIFFSLFTKFSKLLQSEFLGKIYSMHFSATQKSRDLVKRERTKWGLHQKEKKLNKFLTLPLLNNKENHFADFVIVIFSR